MQPLTLKQERVLSAFKRYFDKHGISPTLRELCLDLDLSVAATHEHLKALDRKGYLVRYGHGERNYQLAEVDPILYALDLLRAVRDELMAMDASPTDAIMTLDYRIDLLKKQQSERTS